MKRLIISLFLLIFSLSLISCEKQEENNDLNSNDNTLDSDTSELSIIEFNDVHGFIMQDEAGKRGLSNMAYLVNKERAKETYDNVLLLGNGDMFQGTALVKMSYGEVLIDAMSAMGFDATCLGNHEFDWDLPMILKYFDGDLTNGEANFPLLNANVFKDGKLVTIDNGKIYESLIFNKSGIKVGVIGYIGNVKNSINQVYSDKYYFDIDFKESILEIGTKLKKAGADMIVLSVHDSADKITDFYFNEDAAKLTYNNEYLIDAVICGHTHAHQAGSISRPNGLAMPVIQSRPYKDNYFYEAGKISFEIDLKTKKPTSFTIDHLNVSDAGKNYDSKVQKVIDNYYEKDKTTLEEKYCYSETELNRYSKDTGDWFCDVMLEATGADVTIMNTGGIRASIPAGYLDFNALYLMNPFDNKVIMHEANAPTVNNFVHDRHYYSKYQNGAFKTTGTYTVAVIDYVFNSKYYKRLFTKDYYDTNYVLRDLLIEDLRLREKFNVNENNEAKLSLKVNAYPY